MKGKPVFSILIAFYLAVMLVLPVHADGDGPSPMVKVIVSFDHQPGDKDIELIKNNGGKVKVHYKLVPAIAADIPKNKVEVLQQSPGVRRVESDVIVWALDQTLPWGVDRIDAELVHPANNGTGVKVAVLDTGIDLDHPDLQVAGQATFVAGTTTADDDNGHGTLVAGIIAARNNDTGVIGVAPEAQLYAVKVLDSYGSGLVSDIMSGLQWAVDHQMQVVNMSFGGGVWPWAGEQALANAYNAGIVLVASAGNRDSADPSGDSLVYPARYNPVISVGATDEQNVKLTNSSTGYTLELVAPGANIPSTACGGGLGYLSYTSAASAHVAGAAALLIKAGITGPPTIRQRLADSATDLGAPGWDTSYGKGLINVYNAINFVEPPDRTSTTTTIVLSGTPGNPGWFRSDVTATLVATDSGGSAVAETRYSFDGSTWYTCTSPLTFTEGISQLMARSWDIAGNDEGRPVFSSIKVDKTPPTIAITASPNNVARDNKPGTLFSVNIDASAVDVPDTSGLASSNISIVDEYGKYSGDYGAVRPIIVSLEDWTKANDKDGRIYTITATATDVAGNSTTAIATVRASRQH